MEAVVFEALRALIAQLPNRRDRVVFDTHTILLIGYWAILRDRPFSWACEPCHWPDELRPRHLPDQSTLSRRWRSPELREAQAALHQRIIARFGPLERTAAIDGRPLVVGGASKDPDAKAGRAVGGFARGYKLHAMMTLRAGVVAAWEVRPMNEAEPIQAVPLMDKAPPEIQRVVGDKIFDSMRLHRAARASNRRLYTKLREDRVGRRQQPERLRLLHLLKTRAGRALIHARDQIERHFGRMSNLAFGLKPLPAWVRRLHRARSWIMGKIDLYHVYLLITAQDMGDLRA